MTYYTPTKTFSALWVTAFMPVSGTFATGHTYTHQDLLESAWYFHNVSPEDLGLNQGSWHLSHPWEPWRPEEHAWQDGEAAMLALKNHVLANFRVAIAACARTRCPKPPALRYVLNRTVFEIVEGGHREARQMPWPNGRWSFERGDQYTAEMHHLIPSSDAAWAFIDTPNIPLALTHFGAPDVRLWSWGVGVALSSVLLCLTLTAWCLKRCLKRPTAWLLHVFWSVGSPQSWRERAGRSSGGEDYRPGDLTRTFIRNMQTRVTGGCGRLRIGTSTLRRRMSRRPQYRPLHDHDLDLEDISTHTAGVGHIELGCMAGVHADSA